mgnify:CR=1 FL=1
MSMTKHIIISSLIMFIATLNKTLKSYAFAIIGAEYVLRWLPIGTHDWNNFVKPNELNKICSNFNLKLSNLLYLLFRTKTL